MAASVLMVTSGLVWLFGPFGLIGVGVVLMVLALFVEIDEG